MSEGLPGKVSRKARHKLRHRRGLWPGTVMYRAALGESSWHYEQVLLVAVPCAWKPLQMCQVQVP